MATVDIRKNNKQDSVEAIEKITFYNYRIGVYSHNTAQELHRASPSSERRTRDSVVYIANTRDDGKSLILDSEEQVDKLIKALNLAKKLKWFYCKKKAGL